MKHIVRIDHHMRNHHDDLLNGNRLDNSFLTNPPQRRFIEMSREFCETFPLQLISVEILNQFSTSVSVVTVTKGSTVLWVQVKFQIFKKICHALRPTYEYISTTVVLIYWFKKIINTSFYFSNLVFVRPSVKCC